MYLANFAINLCDSQLITYFAHSTVDIIPMSSSLSRSCVSTQASSTCEYRRAQLCISGQSSISIFLHTMKQNYLVIFIPPTHRRSFAHSLIYPSCSSSFFSASPFLVRYACTVPAISFMPSSIISIFCFAMSRRASSSFFLRTPLAALPEDTA